MYKNISHSSHFVYFLLAVSMLVVVTNPVSASPAKCLLQVDGRSYIDGTCNYEFSKGSAGDNGMFTLGVDDQGSNYFAYVYLNGDANQ